MLTTDGRLRHDWAQELSRRIAARIIELDEALDDADSTARIKPLIDVIGALHKVLPAGLAVDAGSVDDVAVMADAYREDEG